MTRILHIITGLGTGGAERALVRLVGNGIGARVDNHVLSLSGDGPMAGPLEAAGAQLHLPQRQAWGLLPLEVAQLARRLRPDIVQGWMYHGNLAASMARLAIAGAPPVLWNIRQSLDHLESEKLLTRGVIRAGAALSRHPDRIIYNSRLAQSQHQTLGYAGRGSVFIPNGFVAGAAGPAPTAARRAFWQQFGLDGQRPVVLHVGRMHPVKGHKHFLQAAARLLESRADVQFVLIGKDVSPDNPAFGEYAGLAGHDRVRFLGARRDVADFMRHSDIFVLSSLAEAFPNVLGEAMAAGLACVTTDVGDAREILGGNGTVVPAGDAAALEAGIALYLGMPDVRAAHGAGARARIGEHYSIDAAARSYRELYTQVIQEKGLRQCAE